MKGMIEVSDSNYEDFDYSEPEETTADAVSEDWVCPPLVEVGQAEFPRHDVPEFEDSTRGEWARRAHTAKWGRGEPVVTPRLAAKLMPGELELYAGALERKLGYYAWSWANTAGESAIDTEGLVQEALLARWSDDQELSATDTERFAIRFIRSRAIDAIRHATHGQLKDNQRSHYHTAEIEDENAIESDGFVASVFPDAVLVWMSEHVSEPVQEALRLMFEEQYTQEEAAKEVGRSAESLRLAVVKLRGLQASYPTAH